MIGSMVTITIQKKLGWGIFHFGVPLWLVWILLLPLAIVILPLLLFVCLMRLMDPWRVVSVFWAILRALKGTEVEVDDRSHLVAINIR
jgi:hypothetical protein